MISIGGEQETLMLTEVGVYRLIFNSRKPIAKLFKKWVANVIKDLQKNGKYEIENMKKELKDISCGALGVIGEIFLSRANVSVIKISPTPDL